MSLATILALAGCKAALTCSFLHGVVYFLMLHLLLTGLMILKRLHVLLAVSFDDGETVQSEGKNEELNIAIQYEEQK